MILQTHPRVTEKELLVQCLRDSEEKFVSAASVSEDSATIRPAEGWSILEVVEHITLSDREMVRCYLETGSNETGVTPDAEAIIQGFGSDTSSKYQAPPHVLPTGRYKSLAGALKAYRETRNELVDFVNTCAENFRGRLLKSPMTDMDGYQIFLFIAAHSDRHRLQIERIKREIG
jgi:hypothetical protein